MSIKTFIHNLFVMFLTDERQNTQRIDKLMNEVNYLQNQCFEQTIQLMCLQKEKYPQYKEELEYIEKHGVVNFPYELIKEIPYIVCDVDPTNKLPFVLHGGKRLYFPSSYSIDKCRGVYASYISEECLLGGGYRTKAPHQYQTDTFKVEEGDVLVDVGCAEALLALDVIDKVKCCYLIEGDPMWIPALEETFAPYKDKVNIINKFVSTKDSDSTISLASIIKYENLSSIFIKMDIEGAETLVVQASLDDLSKKRNIKLACCTYHKNGDESYLTQSLQSIGYIVEPSDGYMLYSAYDIPQYPIFRRGLIRAKYE